MTDRNYTEFQPIPDRRASDKGLGGKVVSIEDRLDKGDKRMGTIETDLAANTAATNEVLEIVKMGRSFFKFLGLIGTLIKWGIAVAGGAMALWATWSQHK
jgi:hypothetical protein